MSCATILTMLRSNEITRYQNLARQGYLDPLICMKNYQHPPLIVDVDKLVLSVKCVVPDCSYYRDLGLIEQHTIKMKISIAENIIKNTASPKG